MKFIAKSTLLLTLVFFCFNTFGQKFDPSILILYPNETEIEKQFEKEVKEFNENMKMSKKGMDKQHKELSKEVKQQEKNIKFMVQKKIEFENEFDFYSVIPSMAESMLQYRFFQRFKNLLIYAVREKSNGTTDELSMLADKNNMQYIVNFPKVNTFKNIKGKNSTIRIQLYDNALKKIVIDKEFTGDDVNNGFEYTCNEGSIFCTFTNALAPGIEEVIHYVAENNQEIKQERKLYEDRINKIENDLIKRKADPEIVEIIKNNSDRPTCNYFQSIVNEDKTKFVAFFIMNYKDSTIEQIKTEEDKNVNIITDTQNDFDFNQNTYAYVLVGLKSNSKWYFKKEAVTFFSSENLESAQLSYFGNIQKWNFFKENSVEFNPEFWETKYFAKVEDVSKKPDYKKFYESMYKDEERINAPYVGMYEIVADELKKIESKKNEDFETKMILQFFKPFYESQKLKKTNNIKEFSLNEDNPTIIFPNDFSVAINPIKIKDEQGNYSFRFFVYLPDKKEFYEWTYLKPIKFEEKDYMSNSYLVDQISKLTDWNYGFETLDDANFWNKYVLQKEGDKFLYLNKIE
jgi:hypothetical protein